MIQRLCAVALLVLAASCGHKDNQSTTSTTTTTTAQTPSAAAPMRGAGNGVPASTGALNGFADESAAKAHCPSDEIVWVNTTSHIYHEKGTHFYGTTKHGEYACRKEADAAGDRNSKA